MFKLMCEVHEDLRVITEANEAGEKQFFLEGILMQGNMKNKNGRTYPTEILAKEVHRYNRDFVEQNRAYGELGHPQGPTINLEHTIWTDCEESHEGRRKTRLFFKRYG